jgi:hypothetical protein
LFDLKKIGSEWPDATENATIDICTSDTPGIFKGFFDFEIVEGAMILSSNQADLEKYSNHLDSNCDSNDDKEGFDNDKDISEGEPLKRGKRQAPPNRWRPPKKAKSFGEQAQNLFFKWRGRETGEGIYSILQKMDPSSSTVISFSVSLESSTICTLPL